MLWFRGPTSKQASSCALVLILLVALGVLAERRTWLSGLRSPSRGCRFCLRASLRPQAAMGEAVSFQNARGERLAGLLLETESKEVCVLCHGMTDHKNAHFWPDMAEALQQQQVGSLRFDFAGNGDSEGDFKYGNILQEAEDIRAAVDFLRATGRNVTAIAGHSKAGSGVLCYASKYQDVQKVVNISGRLDQKTGITDRFGDDVFERLKRDGSVDVPGDKPWVLTAEDMADRLGLDMAGKAKAIPGSIQVLTIHGSKDATIPESSAHEYAKLISNHTLHVVQGGDHCYNDPGHRKEMIDTAVHFIVKV